MPGCGKPPQNAKLVEGDALDRNALDAAAKGQDVVYADLTGDDLDQQTRNIVDATKHAGVSVRR